MYDAELGANLKCAALTAALGGGTLTLLDAAGGELAVLTFAAPAFRPPANGEARSRPLAPDRDARGGGAAAAFVCRTRGGEAVYGGSAGPANASPDLVVPTEGGRILRGSEVFVDEVIYRVPVAGPG